MLQPSSQIETHPDGTGDLNPIVNGNWNTIDDLFTPALGINLRQDNGTPGVSGSTLTADANIFTSDDVGATILWSTGETASISVVTDGQHATASAPAVVASGPFWVYRSTETGYTGLIRGLLKRVRLVSGDDQKSLVWDNTLKRVSLVTRPGYGVTAKQILYGNGAGNDMASSADLTFDNSTKILALAGVITVKNSVVSVATPSYASTVNLDFSQEGYVAIGTLTGNITFTTSNLATGKALAVKVVCDGTPRNFTFPGTWKWLGAAAPASIAATKTAIISLTAFGAADSNVVASYLVEP